MKLVTVIIQVSAIEVKTLQLPKFQSMPIYLNKRYLFAKKYPLLNCLILTIEKEVSGRLSFIYTTIYRIYEIKQLVMHFEDIAWPWSNKIWYMFFKGFKSF